MSSSVSRSNVTKTPKTLSEQQAAEQCKTPPNRFRAITSSKTASEKNRPRPQLKNTKSSSDVLPGESKAKQPLRRLHGPQTFVSRVESTRSLGPSIRPHSEARRESSPSHGLALTASKQPQQRPLRETRGTFSRLLSSAKDTKHVQNTMNSDKKIARSGSVKPKLCPRREFGPAQDYYPTRQYSLKIHHGRATGNTRNSFEFKKPATEANKQDLLKKIRASNSRNAAIRFGLTYSKLRFFCGQINRNGNGRLLHPRKINRRDYTIASNLLYRTAKHDLWWGFLEQSSPNIWIRVTQNGDCSAVSDYFLNTCYPVEKYLILASLWDPLLPDPAFDRHFPSYWMDRVQTSLTASKNETGDSSRSILRRLDRVIGLPEEGALMLRDYEHALLGHTSVQQLLKGLAKVLTSSQKDQDSHHFGKIVSHFYLVTEWVVQLIISKGSGQGRKALLSCVLRLMQASWNIGNFNAVMEILLGLRSPALKPLWLSLGGSDAEALYSSLFRKFFCADSGQYFAALKAAHWQNIDKVVPAYLLHIKDLAIGLQQQKNSSLIIMETSSSTQLSTDLVDSQAPKVKLQADFHGENRFLRRLGPGGLGTGSLKLKTVQKSINKVDLALRKTGSVRQSNSTKSVTMSTCHSLGDLSKSVIDLAISTIKKTQHGVIIGSVPESMKANLETLHRGTTVLYLDLETHQVAAVFLKLERCSGTITWCRPPWKDPRKGLTAELTSSYTLDTVETAVSPGLRLKYTNRSGESLAYQDEGYVDLAHVKGLKLSPDINSFSEDIRVSAQKHFQGVIEAKSLRLVYGSTLAENRVLTFLCPPSVGQIWQDTLSSLIGNIKNEDPRMVWLKDQYLFLYYQDDLCMGPLAADAIKVFGGRSWSLTGMLKDRGHKGSWKGASNPARTKKKSYGNIHSINDRGIHEIYESFATEGSGSAPSSPWSSPKLGRKSGVTVSPSLDRAATKLLPFQNVDVDDNGKLKYPCTGSITHGSELTFLEFLDLFKSFSLRLRKDIRTLFANHSVCNAPKLGNDEENGGSTLSCNTKEKKKAFICSLTRNSSTDLTDFKSRNEKRKVYNALAAASIFKNSAGVDTSRRQVVPMDAFLHFLAHFQKEQLDEDETKQLIELHEPDPVLRSQGQLSFEGFARYLMDSSNDAISKHDCDSLDMPLSRYYIATSHNTYLAGHQLKGQSSVELYREILLSGCRCVELDCWDGDDGQPIIYHGHTLTTKISFRDVVQTISEYAFASSNLPVILSIENHCSLTQQIKMAGIFKECLGEKLVIAPASEHELALPSPNQLKNRIIIKNKKLRAVGDCVTKATLQRTTTLEEAADNDEEYDSDFGEDEFEDEQDEVPEQNLTLEEYQQSMKQHQLQVNHRPRTLSVSTSMTLNSPPISVPQHRASVFAHSSQMSAGSEPQKKKQQNCQIAKELSDLVVYCQSVKFKGFYKLLPTALPNQQPEKPEKSSTPVRKTGLRSLESTPSSSSGSLNSLNVNRPPNLASTSAGVTSFDLSSPMYQCSSLHESRAKNLCRKQPLRMLEHTQGQLVRVYPSGMRIDSSNFNPVSVWSCGIQMVAMNYQTVTDANLHLHNSFFQNTQGYILKPAVMWNPTHILYERFLPASKTQEGLHVTHISLTIVSGQYVCRENYSASPLVEVEVIGIPRDCNKYKTKMSSRNALNPIWEETFELDVHLPDLAFLRFTVVDVTSNMTTAQRVVPVNRLRSGYRHLRLHNEMDQPLPLSQLFLCSQFSEAGELQDDFYSEQNNIPSSEKLGRKRMSFLVVHDISDASPYAILKVPENATTKDVIKQAVIKGGLDSSKEHEYVLLEEVVSPASSNQINNNSPALLPTPTQRMVGMQEMPLQVRNKWKHETKFVLKRVGQDPSWRARLGNLMSFNEDQEAEANAELQSRLPSEDLTEENTIQEQEDGKEFPNNADHFLVCIFNVSSKVSYSILQVAKTSTVKDVIAQALAKNRKDSEGERRKGAEDYVLVEEVDVLDTSARKSNKYNKVKRIIDPSENVYLIQLSWKGAGRFILEDKDKLANEHGPLTESYSEPLGPSGLSPSLRRHSRIIASGVRRLSRSFYGGSSEIHSRTGSFAELSSNSLRHHPRRPLNTSPLTLAQSDGNLQQNAAEKTVENPKIEASKQSEPETESVPISKKLSKINLRKLKIW